MSGRERMAGMPTAKDSVSLSMFGDGAHGYVSLNVLEPVWSTSPKHCLATPREWRRHWEADYNVSPWDFVPRAVALHETGEKNRKALLESMSDDGTPDTWWLVFRMGEWRESSSLLLLESGEAELRIDTRLMLVRPTTDEVKRFGQLPAQIGGAA